MTLLSLLFGPPPTPEPTPLPIYDDATAIRYVRTLGYTVIRTKQPPPPRVGQCWEPKRGDAKSRWVRSVGAREMSYALTQDGWPVTIALTTWHRWRQRSRAEVV